MMSLMSAFCSGLCSGAAIHNFVNGNIGMGLACVGVALMNAGLAMLNYKRERR